MSADDQYDSATFDLLTQAVREADELFESGKTGGGGTRHWLRDCFLPALEAHGLVVGRVRDSLLVDKQLAGDR